MTLQSVGDSCQRLLGPTRNECASTSEPDEHVALLGHEKHLVGVVTAPAVAVTDTA